MFSCKHNSNVSSLKLSLQFHIWFLMMFAELFSRIASWSCMLFPQKYVVHVTHTQNLFWNMTCQQKNQQPLCSIDPLYPQLHRCTAPACLPGHFRVPTRASVTWHIRSKGSWEDEFLFPIGGICYLFWEGSWFRTGVRIATLCLDSDVILPETNRSLRWKATCKQKWRFFEYLARALCIWRCPSFLYTVFYWLSSTFVVLWDAQPLPPHASQHEKARGSLLRKTLNLHLSRSYPGGTRELHTKTKNWAVAVTQKLCLFFLYEGHCTSQLYRDDYRQL